MITILLKQIIDLLTGWISSFTQYASDVLEKLDLIEEDTSYLPDIKSDCDDIKDNTAAVITPINNIKSNTDAINTSAATTASNTTAIMNQAVTIGTNSGRAAAFAEDCANNTLDIKDKVVTIASDTTQIRSNGNTLVTDIAEIKDLMQYYFLTNIVTEDASGDICNFDTDLEDYLQKAIAEIPAEAGGITGFNVTKCGKNILDFADISGAFWATANAAMLSFFNSLPAGTYTMSYKYKVTSLNGTDGQYGLFIANSNNAANLVLRENTYNVVANNEYSYSKTFTIAAADVGNFTNAWFYCGRSGNVDTVSFYNFMVEIASSASVYESYNAIVDTISLGSSITDGATVDLLSGMVTIHSTPESFSSITPIAIRTYKGVNNIYSDSGSMEVTYRESLKHYLDKNNQ